MKLKLVALGDLARIRTGKLDANASSPNGKHPFFTCAINPLRIDTYSYECECVLVAGNGDLNVKYYNGRFDAYQRTYIVEPISQSLDCRYLYHFLDSYLAELRKLSIGGVIKYIKLGNLTGAQIPLPPLEEQRRIAAILDKANNILSSCSHAETLRRSLRKKLFLSMFGDPRSNPFDWPTQTIERLTSDFVGGAALAPEDFAEEGIPVLHKGAIKSDGQIHFDTRKKGFVTPQTAQNYNKSLVGSDKVAVTLRDLVPSGPFIGLMAELSSTETPKFLLAQGAYAFNVDSNKILTSYLIALVNMPTFRLVLKQNAVGSTQIHIRLPVFKSIKIPVPPIEIQHQFSTIIRRISRLDEACLSQANSIEALTSSLQNSYLHRHDP